MISKKAVTDIVIRDALERHGMLRRTAGKNHDQYPEASDGKIIALGAQTYAVLTNNADETVGVYHVSGPPTERQFKHIGRSDWRTLTETYRRRIEDAR
jgi:hypothetical protein